MENQIFWAGDSTVATNKIETYPQTGIGQVMYLYLRDGVNVRNFAKNGRSSKSFYDEKLLDQIQQEIGKDDFLFIQFGHNDEKKDPERRTEPFTTFQEYLSLYLQVALEKQAHPLLITPVYRRLFDENGCLLEKVHLEYPEAMLEFGKKRDVPVIDLCKKSRKLFQSAGDENSKKWFMQLKKNEFPAYPDGHTDNTHLRYEGAVAMAGLIAEGLREIGGVYGALLSD